MLRLLITDGKSSQAGATQNSLRKDWNKHRRLQSNSGKKRLTMLLLHISGEPERHLKSFLKHIWMFLFLLTTNSLNIVMVCFKVEAKEKLQKKDQNCLPKFTEVTIFRHPKEKV